MTETVPGEHWFTRRIVQRPALSGIHAVLKQQIAGNVVTGSESVRWIFRLIVWHRRRDVLHHEIPACIANPERLAFRVEPGEGDVLLIHQLVGCVSKSIVSNRDGVAPETIQKSERRCVMVLGRKPRASLFLGYQQPASDRIARQCLSRIWRVSIEGPTALTHCIVGVVAGDMPR